MPVRFFGKGNEYSCRFADTEAAPEGAELLFALKPSAAQQTLLENEFYRELLLLLYRYAMIVNSTKVKRVMTAMMDTDEMSQTFRALVWRVAGESAKVRTARGGTAPVMSVLPPDAKPA
jgi:hypothetical protein